ncbi:hypothetical protein DFH06DRAFT_1191096 [Mycena polygramma]|nr:hypothetical protein DFH06DRAFT_1191096 [Mycena polygramma]
MGVIPSERDIQTYRDAASGLEPWIARAWYRLYPGSFDHLSGPSHPERPSTGFSARFSAVISRGLQSKAPIVTGTIVGTVALILFACLAWLLIRRRKEMQDKERAVDLVSRPFILSAKPGISRLQTTNTALSPPGPVQEGISPRRNRRKPPPPPLQPPPLPPQHVKQKERRTGHSSTSRSIFGRASQLPPVSEGYGVGLMTQPREISHPHRTPPPKKTHRDKRTRSSISKSILGLRWHLPPVSEGYGVGLNTREVPNSGQSPSYQ